MLQVAHERCGRRRDGGLRRRYHEKKGTPAPWLVWSPKKRDQKSLQNLSLRYPHWEPPQLKDFLIKSPCQRLIYQAVGGLTRTPPPYFIQSCWQQFGKLLWNTPGSAGWREDLRRTVVDNLEFSSDELPSKSRRYSGGWSLTGFRGEMPSGLKLLGHLLHDAFEGAS